MGEVINLQDKELERFYNQYFTKIKMLHDTLEVMEKPYRDMDINNCDDKALKFLVWSDETLTLLMQAIDSRMKKLGGEIKEG